MSELQVLEIISESIINVGSGVLAEIHMSHSLKDCEGDIYFEA